jgi:hypothetical protein
LPSLWVGGRFFSQFELNLSGSLEAPVPRQTWFLRIFKANKPQICVKLNASDRKPSTSGQFHELTRPSARQETIHHADEIAPLSHCSDEIAG